MFLKMALVVVIFNSISNLVYSIFAKPHKTLLNSSL